ncbi:hypothetical protein ABZP36_026002 [Zizania latifolia]
MPRHRAMPMLQTDRRPPPLGLPQEQNQQMEFSVSDELKQHTRRHKFWEYQEQSNTWVEISMPFSLMSCINNTCTEVGSIEQLERRHGRASISSQEKDTETDGADQADRNDPVLPKRRRISLTRMSESSVWVTGQSGSIYERYWNGIIIVLVNQDTFPIYHKWIPTGGHRTSALKVALRKFKWKDCQSPPDTKIAFIVDQEVFRRNVIFVVGRNGRLYQYRRITELWHKHYQSPHLVLSRLPGTAMRPFPLSLASSIFMVSEHGGLVAAVRPVPFSEDAVVFELQPTGREAGGAAARSGRARPVGVSADHRHAGQRLHDQLLDGRRHVAAAAAV